MSPHLRPCHAQCRAAEAATIDAQTVRPAVTGTRQPHAVTGTARRWKGPVMVQRVRDVMADVPVTVQVQDAVGHRWPRLMRDTGVGVVLVTEGDQLRDDAPEPRPHVIVAGDKSWHAPVLAPGGGVPVSLRWRRSSHARHRWYVTLGMSPE